MAAVANPSVDLTFWNAMLFEAQRRQLEKKGEQAMSDVDVTGTEWSDYWWQTFWQEYSAYYFDMSGSMRPDYQQALRELTGNYLQFVSASTQIELPREELLPTTMELLEREVRRYLELHNE